MGGIDALLHQQRVGLGRMGAPYDRISFPDLATMDLSAYKLIFFPALFAVDAEKQRVLDERVCRDGRTVLWSASPGIIRDGVYDEANITRLTGLARPQSGLQSKAMDGWRSVFAAGSNLSAAVIRGIAQEAGVHLYLEGEAPVYVNQRLIAIHSKEGGVKRVTLPRPCRRVRELFGNRIVGENCAAFIDELAAPATALYHLEWD